MAQRYKRLTYSLIVLVGFLTVCPVLMLFFGSLSEGLTAFGSFTVDKYIQAYTDPDLFKVLFQTALFVFGASSLSTGLALFLAYISTRTDMPFRFLFKIIPVIPMMIPHILFSVSWVMLLNPSNGILNLLLRQIFGIEGSVFNIYSLPGMIMVEGLLDLPIAYLIIAPAMSSFDVTLEESSRVCGADSFRTLFKITLPVLRPAILAAFILCIIRGLASFAVPSAIGMKIGRAHV